MWPQAGIAGLMSAMGCTLSARAGQCVAMTAQRGSGKQYPGRLLMGGVWPRSVSLAQDSGSFMRHIKKTFILLLTLAFLLSAVAYVSDFSFETIAYSQTWLTKIRNWTHAEVINSNWADRSQNDLLAPLPNQQIQPRGTTIYHHVAHPSNYNFMLDEPDKCKQDPFLVLMVPVAPHEVNARNAIRSTWGNESSVQGKAVLTLFLVGLTGGAEAQQKLEEESRQHRDLVQSNFVDSYFNLTIKTMVIMDWLATRCPQAAYAMKVDSDMYIGLENLMSLLLSPNTPRQNYITGYLMWNRPVVRNKNSKWYVSEELYPESTYPTYLLGMAYLFSNDLPEKIVEASKEIKPFNIEDAYVGACLKHLGIAPSSPPDPSQFRAYLGQYNREDFFRVITTILGSPQQLIDIWKDVKRPS
ncbi:beta-1,3-galactosyltransferase 1-like isoform X1 [Carassius auratus]|uniref:Hexosyltransferase n=1 Tax=Carassius auratus TaxID=7957 RepID=A0A6P6J1G3_CARAU|nr:beta-1,3-galactosyltransferase 1-like isoform X1 [Carassius auratus]